MEHHEYSNENETPAIGSEAGYKDYGGVSARALFIPVVAVLAILNIVIIVLMFSIFSQSAKLSQMMQDSSTYISDATSIISGSSVLSETSSNYVLRPVNSYGEPNVGPLKAYASEMLQTDHRGQQVLERFKTYKVSDGAVQNIEEAAKSADALIDLQTHAIALVNSVYPLPDIPELAAIELPELSAEEAALSDDEKIALAESLVLGDEWGTNKNSLSNNVNAAVGNIRASSGEQAAEANQRIAVIRTLLIVSSSLVVIFLAISLFMFYRLLISPLGRFSNLIIKSKPLDDSKGLKEMRLLAGSHNALSHRRDALEEILREAAETDTLTGLQNRYGFQQYLLDAKGESYSLTVFLFDVDNLKQTNDTFGHSAGDDLLRRAAHCISTCFGSEIGGRCYRMAGDEFAAVVRDLDDDSIAALAEKLEAQQKQDDVSISWGYAHTKDISNTSFKDLLDEADRNMYKMKEIVHRSGNHFE